MSRIRSKWTGPERRLAAALKRRGIRHSAHVVGIPGSPDFLVPTRGGSLAVFVNGCFWHRHKCRNGSATPRTNGRFWIAKFEANVRRDARNKRRLRRLGFATITVWECAIAKDVDRVVDRIGRRSK